MSKRKNRYNLPHDTKYTIVDTYSLGEDDFIGCENCGKVLKHIAVVQNDNGDKFHIGMECAKTLQGLDTYDIEFASNPFNEAKRINAKVNKALKNANAVLFVGNAYYTKDISIKVAKHDNPTVVGDYYMCETVSVEFMKKYLPKFAKLCKVNFNILDRETIVLGLNIGGYTFDFYTDPSDKKMFKCNVVLFKDGVEVDRNSFWGFEGADNQTKANSECVLLYNKAIFNNNITNLI